jgi:DNA-binding transcriptional regulator YiaG
MSSIVDRLQARAAQERSWPQLPSPAACVAIRRAARASQEDLALELGVDRATVSRWENGERLPSGPHRARYVEVLHDLQSMVLAG